MHYSRLVKGMTCVASLAFVGALSALFLPLIACSRASGVNGCPYAYQDDMSDGAGYFTGCDCTTAATLVQGASFVDWPQDEPSQANLWAWWVGPNSDIRSNGVTGTQTAAWTRSGYATGTYNCAGYMLAGSSAWVNEVDPFIGTTSGCYKLDASGTEFRYKKSSTDFHICTLGYLGKCGMMFVQDHNDDIYGAMPDTYLLIP
jgi:hypothetical protein